MDAVCSSVEGPEAFEGQGLVGACVLDRRVFAAGPESTRFRGTGYTMPPH